MGDPRRSAKKRSRDDRDFHMAIARASGSTIYHHLMSRMQDVLAAACHEMRLREFATPQYDAMIMEQHTAIVEAIETRDPARARAAMQEHLDFSLKHYAVLAGKREEDTRQERLPKEDDT